MGSPYSLLTRHYQQYENIQRCTMLLRRIMSPTTKNVVRSSCKFPDIFLRLKKKGFSRQIFIDVLNIKFHGSLSRESRADT